MPLGHPDFGKAFPCECRLKEMRTERMASLVHRSNLGPLRRMTFASIAESGLSADPAAQRRFMDALAIARTYAEQPEGWLVLAGASGSGKTHLAAAIANTSLDRGTPALFIVVADLLDHLRSSFSPQSGQDFDQVFDDVRSVDLLVLDDIGGHSATPWAEEKLYQVLNHRAHHQLPTVITSTLPTSRLDDRVRTRLNDPTLARVIDLSDLREGQEDALDVLGTATLSKMRFEAFDTDGFGLADRQRQSLRTAVRAATEFAERPEGWLVLIGDVGTGKTHLAAAIANHRVSRGLPVRFVVVPDLLDHLRSTFGPDSTVSYDDLVQRIRTAPVLVLDDLGTQTSTPWAREKLFQIVNHRYNDRLPTVFTSNTPMEELWALSPAIASRMMDTTLSTLVSIDAPDHRSGEMHRPAPPPAPNRTGGRRRP